MSARSENGGSPVPDVVTAPSLPGGQRPIGTVVASAVGGLRTLLRQHAELAKIEVSEAVSVRAQGAGMFAAAGVVAMYAIGFAGATIAAGLAVVLPVWAAILIVTVLLVIVAGVLVLVRAPQAADGSAAGERTRETLKEDARWAQQQIAR